MKIKPLRPDSAIAMKRGSRPDEVMIAFNQEITEHIKVSTGVAIVKQKDVIERIKNALESITTSDILDKGWLNIEAEFRKAGWTVNYEKPSRDESFDAYFRFQKKG